MLATTPNQYQLPEQPAMLAEEDRRRSEVENALVGLEAEAAERQNLRTPHADLITQGLAGRMLEARVALTTSHAILVYPPIYATIGRFADLLASTRDLAQRYRDFHPRAEDQHEPHLIEGQRGLTPFSYEQLKLIKDSLIEMWVKGDEDAQARAEEVLVGTLFPGQSKASSILHPESHPPARGGSKIGGGLGAKALGGLKARARGSLVHRLANNSSKNDGQRIGSGPGEAIVHHRVRSPTHVETVSPTHQEPDIIPLDQVWLSPGDVATAYDIYDSAKAQGMALLRIIMDTTGDRLVGVFVRVPVRGRHHATDSERIGQVRIVPFRTTPGGKTGPDFSNPIELHPGDSWSLGNLTGINDGGSLTWRKESGDMIFKPGASGSAQLWGPQSRLFASRESR